MKLGVNLIRTDGGTQPRVVTEQRTVTEYAEDMKAGAEFPPVVVYHDGTDHWLADGFHRVLAARVAGIAEIEAEVRMGTQRDALLFACGANAAHGMRRTNDDKRRAVLRLLEDPEWTRWSDREIAKRCSVGRDLVGELRATLTVGNDSEESTDEPPAPRTYTTKHGTTATMDTSRIGRRRQEREPERPPRFAPKQAEMERDEPADEEPDVKEPPVAEAPVVDREPVGEGTAPDTAVAVCRDYLDITISHVRGFSGKHMVINEMIKYLRTLSIDLNRKAGLG